MSRARTVSRIAVTAALAAAVTAVPAAASTATASSSWAGVPTSTSHRPGCVKQLTHAVRAYIRTTDQRDARGFERLLANDYTAILPGGTVLAGKAAGSAFIDRFFARTDWAQTFSETRRAIEGCRTALVVFNSTYTDEDGAVPLVIGLSWTYRDGQWLVLQDQNTVVS